MPFQLVYQSAAPLNPYHQSSHIVSEPQTRPPASLADLTQTPQPRFPSSTFPKRRRLALPLLLAPNRKHLAKAAESLPYIRLMQFPLRLNKLYHC
ncbi:hypothetical protein D3C84_632120 [compost metagenome]